MMASLGAGWISIAHALASLVFWGSFPLFSPPLSFHELFSRF